MSGGAYGPIVLAPVEGLEKCPRCDNVVCMKTVFVVVMCWSKPHDSAQNVRYIH